MRAKLLQTQRAGPRSVESVHTQSRTVPLCSILTKTILPVERQNSFKTWFTLRLLCRGPLVTLCKLMPLEMRLAALAVLLPLVRATCTQDADAMCPAFVESVGTHRTRRTAPGHTQNSSCSRFVCSMRVLATRQVLSSLINELSGLLQPRSVLLGCPRDLRKCVHVVL